MIGWIIYCAKADSCIRWEYYSDATVKAFSVGWKGPVQLYEFQLTTKLSRWKWKGLVF